MSRKKLLIVFALVLFVLGVGLYIRQTFVHTQNCIVYYDKTGAKVLYKDCKSSSKL